MVAGSFYPADKAALEYQLDKFLKNAPTLRDKGDVVMMIVPHAGYPYSGQIAADAYKQIAGQTFARVIIIGTSHKATFEHIALPDYEDFATPLGKLPVDQEFIRKFCKLSDRFKLDNLPFNKDDNAIEVQLPFLQKTQAKTRIVPILFGNLSLANCQALAYALSLSVDDNTLIIASSDWSHYHSYDMAKQLDSKGIAAVVNDDLEGLIKAIAAGETEACGAPGIITLTMLTAPVGVNKIELVKYANSGDITNDKSSVVGYASIIFYRQGTALTAIEKQKLLRIARRTLASKLSGRKLPTFEPAEANLNEARGVFVTLNKDGEMRGCIGYIQTVKPLHVAVQEMALAAGFEDNRFSPLTKEEFKTVKIEVSVLSRMKKVVDASEIKVGRDGLYIIQGDKSGILLPQVAVEWGWDREEFLDQVCIKAGLPKGAWRGEDVQLYRFTADLCRER